MPTEPIPPDALHACIDIQRLFAEDTAWHTPALGGIVPAVQRLCVAMPDRTAFLRFTVPRSAAEAPGRWRRFYERWPEVTGERLDPGLIELVAPLAALARPSMVFDKPTFSMFGSPGLVALLDTLKPSAIVFSGVETDCCVLASVLDALDRGYRCVVATDAVTSASIEAHEAVLAHVLPRQSPQIDLMSVDTIVQALATVDA